MVCYYFVRLEQVGVGGVGVWVGVVAEPSAPGQVGVRGARHRRALGRSGAPAAPPCRRGLPAPAAWVPLSPSWAQV